jgi:hypothetical protein
MGLAKGVARVLLSAGSIVANEMSAWVGKRGGLLFQMAVAGKDVIWITLI